MAKEQRLTMTDGSIYRTKEQITQETLKLLRKPLEVDQILSGYQFSIHSFDELPSFAGTLEVRTDSNAEWKFAGQLHFPTDVNVSGSKSLSLLDQVVFSYQSFKGVVYFAIDRPDRLKRIDEKLQRQLREHERLRVLEERAQIISDLKRELVNYCSDRFQLNRQTNRRRT